jgi:hypothetical protein
MYGAVFQRGPLWTLAWLPRPMTPAFRSGST